MFPFGGARPVFFWVLLLAVSFMDGWYLAIFHVIYFGSGQIIATSRTDLGPQKAAEEDFKKI